MRSALLSFAGAVAAIAMASNAQAVTLNFTEVEPGVFSAFFGNTHSGGFNDTYTFSPPSVASASLTLSAAVNSGTTNVNFSPVTFNGAPVLASPANNTFFEFKDVVIGSGTNTLEISGGGAGSYGGTIKYVIGNPDGNPAGAVPEPAAWAMMVGGFGLMGGALRTNRRRKVNFNFA